MGPGHPPRPSDTGPCRAPDPLLDHYVPQYGPEWESFLDANVYARIDAQRMFVFHQA